MLKGGSVTDLWSRSIDTLREHLDPQLFAAWIKPLSGAEVSVISGRELGSESVAEFEVVAPNKFCREHVERNYARLLVNALREVSGKEVSLRFKVGKDAGLQCFPREPQTQVPELSEGRTSAPVPKRSQNWKRQGISSTAAHDGEGFSKNGLLQNLSPSKHENPRLRSFHETNLNPKYNFSNFVVGRCNEFSYAVGRRVSENLGCHYNPLFIYGGVGLGKTHLVNAIGNASRRRGKNVLLASSEVFVNELISSLRSNRMEQFKAKFRSLDLLIIDDVQFIIGKERTQEEFFHTFNELHQRQKQIIITSDKVPQELIGLEDRLRTRFASGLSADIQAPDFETRVAILTKKSEVEGITLPYEVAEYLATKIDTNVRELEGALNRLHALSFLQNSAITSDLAREAVKALVPERTREIGSEFIQKVIAERFGVSLGDLLGKRRTQNIAFARQLAMYLCRKLTRASYPEIGAVFGGRDHVTVLHATRTVEVRMKEDPKFGQEVGVVEKMIVNG